MLLKQLLENLQEYDLNGHDDVDILDIVIDSRKAGPGSLFVCIPGSKVDRHAFSAQVVEAGAVALVVEKIQDVDVPQILVHDSRKALARLAAAFFRYPARDVQIIGVTGTKGKTTTTWLIKSILERYGEKIGLLGTMANYVGSRELPQTLTTPDPMEFHSLLRQMADAGCRYVIMEVSAHALELHKMEGIHFRVGVYTNLSHDHLDDFVTMERYRDAKKRMFDKDLCQSAVINADDAYAEYMVKDFPGTVVRYGLQEHAHIRATRIHIGINGLHYELDAGAVRMPIHMHLSGKFNVYNSLAAAAVCMQLGFSLTAIAEGLSAVEEVSGRVQRVRTDTDYAVFVDYAHSPDSLQNILETARGFAEGGRLIVVFGCGGNRDPYKRPVMGKIAVDLADFVVMTSDNPRTEEPESIIDMIEKGVEGTKTPYIRIADRRKAIGEALKMATKGDIIVIAGKGHETYQDVMGTKHHFDDREVVLELLQTMDHSEKQGD